MRNKIKIIFIEVFYSKLKKIMNYETLEIETIRIFIQKKKN